MKHIITYQVPTMNGGWTEVRTYECKDDEDYRRCVNLNGAKKLKILTIDGKEIR